MRIREIEVSDHVRVKINNKHGLTEDDVLDVCENHVGARWDDDPERGRRLLITGHTQGGHAVMVVLHPVDAETGSYRLVTAIRD